MYSCASGNNERVTYCNIISSPIMSSCLLLSLLAVPEKQNASDMILDRVDRLSVGSDPFASLLWLSLWLGLQSAPFSDPCSPTGHSDKLISHTWQGNRRPGLISRRDVKDGGRRGGRERRRERRLKIKMRKTLLTEPVTPGYLFMGLLKRTLEQSALPTLTLTTLVPNERDVPGCCFCSW